MSSEIGAGSIGVSLLNGMAALQRAVGAKNAYTAEHNQRVSEYSVNLARAMGLHSETVESIRIGALLHDVGKIGISDAVLQKATTLTPAESCELERHSTIGLEICEPLGLGALELAIIRHHHERLDGSGYPDRLRGSRIPLEVQVVAITDVVDTSLTASAYRPALAMEEVTEIIAYEAFKGLHDRSLVRECTRIMATGELFSPAGDTFTSVSKMCESGPGDTVPLSELVIHTSGRQRSTS